MYRVDTYSRVQGQSRREVTGSKVGNTVTVKYSMGKCAKYRMISVVKVFV